MVFMGPDGTPASRKNVTASAESVEVTVPVRQVVSLPLTVEIIEGGGAAREDVEVTISPEPSRGGPGGRGSSAQCHLPGNH